MLAALRVEMRDGVPHGEVVRSGRPEVQSLGEGRKQRCEEPIGSRLVLGGGDDIDGEESLAMKGVPKWTSAHPMASVSSVLMQSVEPLEDFMTNVTDLSPIPNHTAPSACEVRLAVARRRVLDRERAKHAPAFQATDSNVQDQLDQAQPLLEGGSTPIEHVVKPMLTTPGEHSSEPKTKIIELENRVEVIKCSISASAGITSEQTPASAAAGALNDLVPEASQDSRLVLPVLESLIALRRSRLNRAAPPPPSQQPHQQPHPPVRPSTMSMSGAAAAATVGGDGNAASAAKSPGAKPTRRFGPPAPPPTSQSSAATSSGSTAVSVSQSQLRFGPLEAPVQADSPLASSPSGSSAAAAAAAAATAATGGGDAVHAGAAAAAAAESVSRLLEVDSKQLQPQPSPLKSPTSPATGGAASQAQAAAAATAAVVPGGGQMYGNASTLACRISRFSPRTSIELGLESGVAEAPEDSGATARSVTRQRALLQEWQEWRERGGLGPPPGVDEETDCSESGGDDDDDSSDDGGGDGGRLLLGLTSSRQAKEATAAAVGRMAAAADEDEEAEENPPQSLRGKGWRSRRRITQSFDLLGLEGLAEAVVPSCPTSMSAPMVPAASLPPTAAAPPTAVAPLSCMTSPVRMISSVPASGPGTAPLSPMASRRRGESGGRPGVGPLALPIWLNKSFGGGGGGGGAVTTIDAVGPAPPLGIGDVMPYEDGNRTSAPATQSPGVSTAAAGAAAGGSAAGTATRIPSLAGAKHLSFTSKFNRFKERIQSFSQGRSALTGSGGGDVTSTDRASPAMTGGAAVPARPRVAVSNDGRNAILSAAPSASDSPPQLVMARQAPPTPGRKNMAGAGAAAAGAPDLQIRPTGRGSFDNGMMASKSPQAQQPGASGSRAVTARYSLDSRLSTSRGRVVPDTVNSPPAAAAAAAVAVAVGSPPGPAPPPSPHPHEALVVGGNALGDRGRRVDLYGFPSSNNPGLLPPVRLL
ncbi:hypothetical protein VOLCADRAFT_98119 [Volvox carteri f. nagariensis]|uniref:Uncharacterized protein n=1 Tax=Volvox carteri f. nagariensis TaxID=3068 RepID=D8UEH7_VOLCA|nr:uncharacterized protein VOLCADRAFT_98119 [Volvox carteri f. nagariensis]EFJ41847.1 hypothetical protein VOLCADRAFT_98119 [Volvox carteri f. nagariensis]|eukprot:XP_002957045.1 hypothetical protein VOLCADRAFT_98119 [Volvox carteri f. nagariensis]